MRKIFWWVLWLIIGGIAFAVGLNRLIDALIHSKKDRIVPKLIGINIADSLDVLSSINLYLKKGGEEFNSDVPAGLIISQSPVAGSVIKEGKAVNVVVSVGGEVIFVPDLANQTVRSGQLILRKNGLDLGEQDEKYSTVIEKGKIISQNPNPRTSLAKNGLVNIVVSLGTPPEGVLLMPDFLGKNITEAESWAQQFGVQIKNVNSVKDPAIVENTVVKQMPESDIVLGENKTAEFWIAVRNTEQTQK
ncbi:MAG: PASTA domain-containing protein [Elusimicrobia bacterium]|nr:PASTA domain-containing protein [Elusimicrobiota bacterium]